MIRSTAPPAHDRERRQQTLARVRAAAWAILGMTPFAVAGNLTFFPYRQEQRLAGSILNAVVCVIALVITRRDWANRHATSVALVFNFLVCIPLLLMVAIAPTGLEAFVGVLLVAMVGAALLYPWGALAQAILSIYLAAGYAAMVPWTELPEVVVVNMVIALSLGVGVSIAGAFVLDRQRMHKWILIEELAEASRRSAAEAAFAQAIARAGEELIGSLNLPATLENTCRLTTELLECDSSHTLLRRPEDGAFAPIAMFGEAPEHAEALRVMQLPSTSMAPLIAMLERSDVRQIVLDDLQEISAGLGQQMGYSALLQIALRRGNELIGILSANLRTPGARFTPDQERIAASIGHLASMALDNARLAAELEEAGRLKGEFVATMSHELRTPLNSLLGYGDLLLEGHFGELSHEQASVMRRMRNSANQLHELITTTLDLSRLQAQKVALRLEQVSVSELLLSVVGEIRDLEDKPDVALLWDVARDLPVLETDPLKLKVVLKHLIANAIKFTDTGSVGIAATAIGGHVDIAIRDTGIGIPRDSLAAVFEPFRQAERSLNRRFEGAGLGLYVVQRLLGVLGGSVSVESEVGRGSVFRVRLPLRTVRRLRPARRVPEPQPVIEIVS